jgi:hypothetical protein
MRQRRRVLTNKSDFLQWRGQDITKDFQTDMLEVIDDIMMYLAKHAGKDQLEDRRLVGVIEGVQWLIDWQPTLIDDEGDFVDADSQRAQALS